MTGDINQAHLKKLENLPKDWIETSVDEVVKIVSTNKKKLPQKKYMDKAEYPVIDQGKEFIGGYHEDKSMLIEGKAPFIVFGDHSRVFKYANFNFIPGADGVKVMQPFGVYPKWAFYIFQAIKLPNKGYARHFQYLKEAYLPVPPLKQQKQIVAKIEELFSHIDAGIESLKKAKQLLKKYRQSVLKAAVTGALTKEWREQNKDKLEPANKPLERILKERREKWEEQQLETFKAKGKIPKNDKWKEKYKEPASMMEWSFLSELPDSWSWTSVSGIGDTNDQPVLTGPFGSNLGKKDFKESGVPVLTIGCLQEAGIELSKAMYVNEKKLKELERYQLKKGDMLFSRMAAVGRAGYVTKDLEGCLFNYHIMRLRLHKSAILQDYFVHYVRGSREVYEYVKEVNHGATRDGINTQQLLEMPVALPCLNEQYEICRVVEEKLDSIRRLESEVNSKLLMAQNGKHSILASAFSGRIL